MNDEEILRKKLDRLNQNSHYGIMIDTEITKIVRSHIKRLEENKMKATSVQKIENVKEMHFTIEKACTDEISKVIVGVDTNDDIFEFHFSGIGCDVFADQWFNAVAEKAYKEDFESEKNKRIMAEAENKKYEEKIKKLEHDDMLDKNAADYWSKEHDILLERFAKLQVENEKLKDKVEHVEPFRALERTIREKHQLQEENEKLQQENEDLEKQLNQVRNDKETVRKSADYWADKARALEKSFTLEKAANEAQHRFIREYAGKDTEVEFNYVVNESENEVSYVIVDKEEKEKIYKDEIVALIHGVKYTVEGLVDRILDLEKLKTPTIENFAQEHENLKKAYNILNAALTKSQRDCNKWYKRCLKMLSEDELKYQLGDIQATKEVVEQKLNTREGILEQAKKCVCGQREQDYGTPESNFQLIADLWNGYLGFTSYVLELEEHLMELKDKGIDVNIDIPEPKAIFPKDVAMMMALLKIARIRNGGGSGDSFVDLAGYAACGGEIWHEQKVKDQN